MQGIMLIGPSRVDDHPDRKPAAMQVASLAAYRQLKMRRVGDSDERSYAAQALNTLGMADLSPDDKHGIEARCGEIHDDFVRIWNECDIDDHTAHSLTSHRGFDIKAMFVRAEPESTTYRAICAAQLATITDYLECY